MSLLLLTVTLRGVSNKHCLLPLFSFDFRLFLSLMDVDGRNPSNQEDLKLYWHHLQLEGIDPSDVYEEFLIRLGVLTPEVTELEVYYLLTF